MYTSLYLNGNEHIGFVRSAKDVFNIVSKNVSIKTPHNNMLSYADVNFLV
jgi:hypothetical protein